MATAVAKDNSSQSLQVVVFRLGEEEYGLLIDQIKEVVLTPAITRMPQTPAYIKGVANIRGNVMAILDLAVRFGIAAADATHQPYKYTLVAESEELRMGLLVHDVPNTVTVSGADLDESVGIIADNNSDDNYIKGIIKTNNRLIILIDIFKVVSLDSVKKTTSVAA